MYVCMYCIVCMYVYVCVYVCLYICNIYVSGQIMHGENLFLNLTMHVCYKVEVG